VQRPGSVAAAAFFDLRLLTLFAEPTVAEATKDSYWTQLFAKLWFDYDPKFLIATPASRALACAWYATGLAISCAWLAGLVLALRRWRSSPGRLALVAVQLAFLAVPLTAMVVAIYMAIADDPERAFLMLLRSAPYDSALGRSE